MGNASVDNTDTHGAMQECKVILIHIDLMLAEPGQIRWDSEPSSFRIMTPDNLMQHSQWNGYVVYADAITANYHRTR